MLVAEAVERTLRRLAADYPLDYGELVARYKQGVVQECCGAFDGATDKCAGTTRAGKPCGRLAVACGFCAPHLQAWQQEQAAQRRADVYAESLKRDRDTYAEELQRAGMKRTMSMSFSPRDRLV